jgi:serine/threonine protein kinase
MGQVYLGRSAGGRLVAVKVIRPELAEEPGFRTRFAREVAAARTVSGLFTALVVDADLEGSVPWLATAYVAGPSLTEAVAAQGPLPVASVLTLAAGLAEGLEAIHAVGVVHRDLKPSNVLLAEDGPRVIDFGISRAAEATMLTQVGTVIGSPGFMSPEQAEGNVAGPPSDVFSLGAVLAFAATGEGPFGTGSTPALMYRVVHRPPDIARVPAQIRPVIERCLAKDPSQRPTSGDLLAELGAGQLAADWLPAPLTEVFSRYAPPGTAVVAGLTAAGSTPPASVPAAGPTPPAGIPAEPATTTGVSTPRPSAPPSAQAQPAGAAAYVAAGGGAAGAGGYGGGGDGDAAGRSHPRNRRRLVWIAAFVVAGLMASASTALALNSSGGPRRGTTGPSPRPRISATALAHPARSASPTSPPASFAQTQPTAGQYSPTPTPTWTSSPTPTPTWTSSPTSNPTSTSLPTPSPT